jgi:hypothetical protein
MQMANIYQSTDAHTTPNGLKSWNKILNLIKHVIHHYSLYMQTTNQPAPP